jgi:hypothetical protein
MSFRLATLTVSPCTPPVLLRSHLVLNPGLWSGPLSYVLPSWLLVWLAYDAASEDFFVIMAGSGAAVNRDWLHVEIGEDEFDNLVLEGDVEEILENTRWMAVARFHCPKTFSHDLFFQHMCLA